MGSDSRTRAEQIAVMLTAPLTLAHPTTRIWAGLSATRQKMTGLVSWAGLHRALSGQLAMLSDYELHDLGLDPEVYRRLRLRAAGGQLDILSTLAIPHH
jgi:hypothetical protein